MTGNDRDELVELMSRYASIPDTQDWDVLPRTVLCDELSVDFSSFGAPVTTTSREAWCRQSEQAFAGWTATHHGITNHQIAVDGDRASVRAHARVEHWAPSQVATEGPSCWLVVGFYDNDAVRTSDGWRLSRLRLTPTHQENRHLLAVLRSATRG